VSTAAVAANVIAAGSKNSSVPKTMTNDNGIVARSVAPDDCESRTALRIAASVRLPNDSASCGCCGQAARPSTQPVVVVAVPTPNALVCRASQWRVGVPVPTWSIGLSIEQGQDHGGLGF